MLCCPSLSCCCGAGGGRLSCRGDCDAHDCCIICGNFLGKNPQVSLLPHDSHLIMLYPHAGKRRVYVGRGDVWQEEKGHRRGNRGSAEIRRHI